VQDNRKTVEEKEISLFPHPAFGHPQGWMIDFRAGTPRWRLAMTRQAVGEISMPIPAREFSRGRRTILLLRENNQKKAIFTADHTGLGLRVIPHGAGMIPGLLSSHE